jgi:hypothetical protein
MELEIDHSLNSTGWLGFGTPNPPVTLAVAKL